EREERMQCQRFALNILVSEEDAKRFTQLVPESSFTVVPNGVDTSEFTPASSAENGLVFVGGYGWYPNRDGMEFFVEHVLPLIRRDFADVPVTWIGRAPDR